MLYNIFLDINDCFTLFSKCGENIEKSEMLFFQIIFWDYYYLEITIKLLIIGPNINMIPQVNTIECTCITYLQFW